MPENITFRTQLIGGLHEFCHCCGLRTFDDQLKLIELVVLLARYKEEGVSLYPAVYITNKLSDMIQMLHGADVLQLGKTQPSIDGLRKIVKKAAPLAVDEWHIYIDEATEGLSYGVFCAHDSPTAVRIDDVIMDPEVTFPVVKIQQVAESCVEVSSSTGKRHIIFLDHRPEESMSPQIHIKHLVVAAVQNVPEAKKDPAKNVIMRMLASAIRKAHGCIIVVVPGRVMPAVLAADGTVLSIPIDIPKLIEEYKNDQLTGVSLENKKQVISGMVNSDGILVLSNDGCVLGYNCFVHLEELEQVNGGARRRAFESVCTHLGREVMGAFFQSQDGLAEYRGETYE